MENKYKKMTDIDPGEDKRIGTGNKELDELLGGGFAKSEVMLLAGEPGCGKSTLLLQVSRNLAQSGNTVLYVGGEESLTQIKQRAVRVGAIDPDIIVTEVVSMEVLLKMIEEVKPQFLITDSLQMLYTNAIKGEPGSQKQTRYCLSALIDVAKQTGMVMIVIGHATKSGAIAGLNTLQHVVDAVFFIENDVNTRRKLIAKKNRYGPAQTGIELRMSKNGFQELRVPWWKHNIDKTVTEVTKVKKNTEPTVESSASSLIEYAVTAVFMIVAVPFFLIKQAINK